MIENNDLRKTIKKEIYEEESKRFKLIIVSFVIQIMFWAVLNTIFWKGRTDLVLCINFIELILILLNYQVLILQYPKVIEAKEDYLRE
jgi:hypothetical protein